MYYLRCAALYEYNWRLYVNFENGDIRGDENENNQSETK